MLLVTVNAGSSSLRLAAIRHSDDGLQYVAGRHHRQGPAAARGALDELLRGLAGESVAGVVHRVVHGGDRLVAPCLIDAAVETQIERLAMLAPLHNPAALAGIRMCREALGPGIPQVAVFDTAFYAGLPAVASRYALPQELAAEYPLRRYGFHGLAHRSMLERWRARQPAGAGAARVISLQLGSGCSITASLGGVPVDTSMGFSPLEGLMMATRCGDIDAGLLLHLQRALTLSPDRLEELLNNRCGLLGVSGRSADMRALLAADDPAAQLAVEMYCYRARKYVGAYLAVLGGGHPSGSTRQRLGRGRGDPRQSAWWQKRAGPTGGMDDWRG
jgi:acetate kinase